MPPIYLDYNATTPIHPGVLEAMMPYLHTHFGNPGSSHPYGEAPRIAVTRARKEVAGLLGASPDEVLFTSGGTEANNLAIFGALSAANLPLPHVVSSNVEHPAVEECLKAVEASGGSVTRLAVDRDGRVAPESVGAALRDDTALVSIMHANNEVGTLNDLAAIGRLTRARGVPFHSDAAQSVGKVATKVDELGVDLLSVAGHKLYAPKGVGALYIRRGTAITRVTQGAGQESGLRPGTENVASIVALGAACQLAEAELIERVDHCGRLRDRLERRLCQAVGAERCRVNGHREHRLPNTLSLSIKGLMANDLLNAISGDVAASAGAACHAGQIGSTVLGAMGVSPEFANGTLRLTTGRLLTTADVDRAAATILEAIKRMR